MQGASSKKMLHSRGSFWSKVDKEGPIPEFAPHLGGCWEWMASTSSRGYGTACFRGKTAQAHSISYRLLVGEVPEGLELDHLCRNRVCVNPDHLEPVTHKENVLRGGSFAALNAAKTHCAYGHPYDEENTYLAPTGGRSCRVCRRDQRLRYREKVSRACL